MPFLRRWVLVQLKNDNCSCVCRRLGYIRLVFRYVVQFVCLILFNNVEIIMSTKSGACDFQHMVYELC